MDKTGPLESIVAVLLFSMVYLRHAQSAACISGEFLNGSSGFVSSPNFPNNYPAYSRCVWNITVPSGFIVKLSFLHFELDPLNRDRVTIRDDGGHPLQLYGQRRPSPVYSMGNSVRLIFTSVDNQYSGFNATYNTDTYDSVCPNMTTLNETSGVITSPFYPRNYPSKQNCSWQITVQTGKHVVLVIEDFDIRSCWPLCTCDYLEVQNGLSSGGALSGRKCGYYNRARLAYYSINDVLKVKFLSDGSVNRWYRGFKATFTQVNYNMETSACISGDFLNGSSGFVSSPNFPNRYPQCSICIWNITVPSGYIIKLSFLHFELDSYPNHDRVTITNIASDDGRHPFQLYGQRLPSPVYSLGNSIQLIFTSLTNQYSGFNATYEAITYETVCANMTALNQTSGVITSPFYPRYYPSKQTCSWQITAETGKYVVLVIENFHIERCGSSCTCDYLEIQNGLSSNGVSRGRKCGLYNYRELVYYSINNVLKVTFVSDDGVYWWRRRGFNATYTQVNFTTATSACISGDYLDGSSGFISSPNFPNKYPAYSRCIWNITVPSGNIIKLSFLHFELDRLNCDRVTIRDDGRHPFQLYGQRTPALVYSMGNSIQQIFTSVNINNQYSGFNVTYKAVTYETVCPNMTALNQTSGVITSPFYPRQYPSKQNCSWQITAKKGKYVVLVIDNFLIESCDSSCTCDYLEIQNGLSSDGASSGRKCGYYNRARLAYYSINDVLKVKFVSDGSVNRWYIGFKATFTQVNYTMETTACISGDFLNGSSGFVSSPNFPNRYPQYSRCIWNITVPSGYIIKLSFLHFELDSYPNGDRVTITNIASDDGRHPFQLYGQRLPSPVYSLGNSIQLIFTSLTNQYSGFNATYEAITYETGTVA